MRQSLFCSIICSICVLCSSYDVVATTNGYFQAPQKDSVPVTDLTESGNYCKGSCGWKYDGQRDGYCWL